MLRDGLLNKAPPPAPPKKIKPSLGCQVIQKWAWFLGSEKKWTKTNTNCQLQRFNSQLVFGHFKNVRAVKCFLSRFAAAVPGVSSSLFISPMWASQTGARWPCRRDVFPCQEASRCRVVLAADGRPWRRGRFTRRRLSNLSSHMCVSSPLSSVESRLKSSQSPPVFRRCPFFGRNWMIVPN